MLQPQQPTSVSHPPRILRIDEVCKRLKISRSTLWRWERAGLIPPKRKIGPNVAGFLEGDIDSFIARMFADESRTITRGDNVGHGQGGNRP